MKRFLVTFLTVLFFLNVFGAHNIIGLLLSIYLFFAYSKEIFTFSKLEVKLFLFGLSYIIFRSLNSEITITTLFEYVLLPILMFKLGIVHIRMYKTEKSRIGIILLSLLSLSFLFIYSTLESLILQGITESRTSNIKYYSLSGEPLTLTVTLIGLHLAPMMSLIPLSLFLNKGKVSKYIFYGSIYSIFAVIAAVVLAIRTPIVILGTQFCLVFSLGIYYSKSARKLWAVVVFFVIILIVLNIDLSSFQITSFLYSRLNSDDIYEAGSRTIRWIEGVENIFLYPLGSESKRIGYFHNLWLDLRYDAGVVPMIFLLIISIDFTIGAFKMMKLPNISMQLKGLLGTVNLSILIMMFMEPVLQGSFIFFLFYIFISSIIVSLNHNASIYYEAKSINHFRL